MQQPQYFGLLPSRRVEQSLDKAARHRRGHQVTLGDWILCRCFNRSLGFGAPAAVAAGGATFSRYSDFYVVRPFGTFY
jgi:hypothetical protein